jgi:hypothetical protein
MKAYIYHSAAHRPVGLCSSSSRDSVNYYVRTHTKYVRVSKWVPIRSCTPLVSSFGSIPRCPVCRALEDSSSTSICASGGYDGKRAALLFGREDEVKLQREA